MQPKCTLMQRNSGLEGKEGEWFDFSATGKHYMHHKVPSMSVEYPECY